MNFAIIPEICDYARHRSVQLVTVQYTGQVMSRGFEDDEDAEEVEVGNILDMGTFAYFV